MIGAIPVHRFGARPSDDGGPVAGSVDSPLEILQSLRLICPQPAVLPLPPLVRLLGHAKLPHHLGHRLPLSQPNLSLAELPDDLLRSELLSSWHLLPSLGLHHQRFSL